MDLKGTSKVAQLVLVVRRRQGQEPLSPWLRRPVALDDQGMNFNALHLRLIGAAIIVGLVNIQTGTVHAEDSTAVHPPVGQSARVAARKLVLQGEAAEARGDLQVAAMRYERAYKLAGAATVGLALARVLAQQGRLREAIALATEVEGSPPRAGELGREAEGRRKAGDLVELLQRQVPALTLEIVPSTASAVVEVDGRMLSATVARKPLLLDPGKHLVKIQAPGFAVQTREVVLKRGRNELLLVGLVLAQSRRTPPRRATVVTAADAARDASGGNTLGWVTAVGGGVVLAAGVFAGLVAVGDANDIKDTCQGTSCFPEQQASIQDALDRGRAFAWVANIAIPVGLVGLGFGLYSLLSAGDAASPALAATLQPAVRGQPRVAVRF